MVRSERAKGSKSSAIGVHAERTERTRLHAFCAGIMAGRETLGNGRQRGAIMDGEDYQVVPRSWPPRFLPTSDARNRLALIRPALRHCTAS